MKPNELRIGNWVLVYDKPWKIDDLEVKQDQICYPFYPEPIPLTEEWLIELGFKRWNSVKSITYSKGLLILHKRKRGWVINKKWIEPKYVHQLQNLYYALTGEEL